MKKTINGKTYNSETAMALCVYYDVIDGWCCIKHWIMQTKKGDIFRLTKNGSKYDIDLIEPEKVKEVLEARDKFGGTPLYEWHMYTSGDNVLRAKTDEDSWA